MHLLHDILCLTYSNMRLMQLIVTINKIAFAYTNGNYIFLLE